METFLLEQPANLIQSKYDVPSFDEAFDTESLKNFYNNQSSPNHFASKFQRDFGFEDDFLVKNFEAISPATTAQSHSFLDFFNPHYEDVRHESSPSAAFNLQNHLSPVQFKPQGQVAKGIRFNFEKEAEREREYEQPQPQKPQGENQNLIAMLCEQMKQYYDQPQQETTRNLLQVVKGETEPFMAKRFMSLDRETSVSFSDVSANRLEDTIIRKLICKKKIFTIQRDQNKDTKAKRKNSDVFKVKRQRAQSLNLPAIQSLLHEETTKMLVEEEKKDKKVKRKGSEAVGKEDKALKKKLKTEKIEKPEKKEKKEKKPKKMSTQLSIEIAASSQDSDIFGSLAI